MRYFIGHRTLSDRSGGDVGDAGKVEKRGSAAAVAGRFYHGKSPLRLGEEAGGLTPFSAHPRRTKFRSTSFFCCYKRVFLYPEYRRCFEEFEIFFVKTSKYLLFRDFK